MAAQIAYYRKVTGERLKLDPALKVWKISVSNPIFSLCVYVNGLRYERDVDYTVDNKNTVMLIENNNDDKNVVLVDYEY